MQATRRVHRNLNRLHALLIGGLRRFSVTLQDFGKQGKGIKLHQGRQFERTRNHLFNLRILLLVRRIVAHSLQNLGVRDRSIFFFGVIYEQ